MRHGYCLDETNLASAEAGGSSVVKRCPRQRTARRPRGESGPCAVGVGARRERAGNHAVAGRESKHGLAHTAGLRGERGGLRGDGLAPPGSAAEVWRRRRYEVMALASSAPPTGAVRWTLKLLAEAAGRRPDLKRDRLCSGRRSERPFSRQFRRGARPGTRPRPFRPRAVSLHPQARQLVEHGRNRNRGARTPLHRPTHRRCCAIAPACPHPATRHDPLALYPSRRGPKDRSPLRHIINDALS